MGEWEEHQCRGLRIDDRSGAVLDLRSVPHEVAHGQHTTLGLAGGSRGVHQRRDVLLRDRGGPLHHLLVGDVLPHRFEVVHPAGLETEVVLTRPEGGGLLQVDLPEIVCCTDDGLRPRVPNDPLDLLG